MTVLTISVPDAATAEIVEHIRRVGGTVAVGEKTLPNSPLPLPPLKQFTPQEEAEMSRIILQGGDPVGSQELARWYEEERKREQSQLRPGYE